MAKAKFLHFLTRRGSSLKSSSNSSSNKKYVAGATTAATSNESDTPKIREDVLMLLNNFPESESESDRELSFSFLLSNSSSEKDRDDDVLDKGGKTEDQLSFSFSAAAKEKKRRKISRSCSSGGGERMGVLLNLHVPASFIKSRSGHVTSSCRTLAELEKREEEFNRVKCWPTLLRRKQDHMLESNNSFSCVM